MCGGVTPLLFNLRSSCFFTKLLGQSYWAVLEAEGKSVPFCQSASGVSTFLLPLRVQLELGAYNSVYISEFEFLLNARSWSSFLGHRRH